MKKGLIITIFMFLLIGDINASTQTYYSPYSDYGPYMDTYVESSDLVDVKKTTMYKFYREERENGDYYIVNKNDPLYPYFDNSDFIKTDYSDWSDKYPSNEIGRTIRTREVYYYQDMKKIRYIHFTNIKGGDVRLNINEIIVTHNEQSIPYTIYCEGCSENFYESVRNGIITFENTYLLEKGYLRIDLNDYYDLSEIFIKLYITDFYNVEKRYTMSVTRDESINSNIYSWVLTSLFTKHNSANEYSIQQYQLDRLTFDNPEWEDVQKSYLPVKTTLTRQVRKGAEYSYQDTLYRHYNIKRVYADGYYVSAPSLFPNIDEKESKEFYQVRTRDKVVIKEPIVINNKNQKLEEFIVEKTVNEIIIDSNINYEQNGTYVVSFVLPFMTIEKEVLVDIEENKTKEKEIIKDTDNQVEKENPQNNNISPINGKTNFQIEENNKDKNSTKEFVFSEKIMNKKVQNKSDEVKNMKEEKIEKKVSRNYIIPGVLLIIIGIVGLYRYRKKSE